LQELSRADSTFKILKGCRRRASLPLNVRRDSNLDARDPPAARPRHNQRHDDVPASALITRFQSRMHRIISDRHPTFVPLYTSTPRYQSVPWKASCYMDSRSRETQEAPFSISYRTSLAYDTAHVALEGAEIVASCPESDLGLEMSFLPDRS